MNSTTTVPKGKADQLQREMAETDASCPFGPSFFMRQLRAFIRDRCPDPSEALPSVQIHLAEGDIIEICHVIGIAPRWMALAAIEEHCATAAPAMRTEVIPYALISRVTVRPYRPEPGRVGFDAGRSPEVLSGRDSPEAAFLAMAGIALPESAGSGPGEGEGTNRRPA